MQRRLGLLMTFLLTGCATIVSSGVDRELLSDDWTLIFSDEFNTGSAPDPDKWGFDQHANRTGWYNEELQYYGPDNAVVEDGSLIITARKGAPETAEDYGGQSWSSARLHTKDRFAFTYGRVEARIQVPCGKGLWPAFWMLPEGTHSWPDGGEIDIMEYVGHDATRFFATVHTKAYNHVDGTQVGEARRVPKACEAWHTHGLDWGPNALTVSLNGDPYFTFENDGKGPASWPFNKDFHLLLNVAIGGSWGGAEGVDEARFPAQMKVDYVRVWQKSDI